MSQRNQALPRLLPFGFITIPSRRPRGMYGTLRRPRRQLNAICLGVPGTATSPVICKTGQTDVPSGLYTCSGMESEVGIMEAARLILKQS